jgi:hypothetical protein
MELKLFLREELVLLFFSDNKYQSLDLDFVSCAVEDNAKAIKEAMREIGFRRAAEGFFEHPDCPFIVEFIPPPLAIGSEPVKEVITAKTAIGSFKLLSPTECVKDRLAAYYHWDDLQSLEQAIMVAKRKKINLREVRRWSIVEAKLDKYKMFLEKLNKRK